MAWQAGSTAPRVFFNHLRLFGSRRQQDRSHENSSQRTELGLGHVFNVDIAEELIRLRPPLIHLPSPTSKHLIQYAL